MDNVEFCPIVTSFNMICDRLSNIEEKLQDNIHQIPNIYRNIYIEQEPEFIEEYNKIILNLKKFGKASTYENLNATNYFTKYVCERKIKFLKFVYDVYKKNGYICDIKISNCYISVNIKHPTADCEIADSEYIYNLINNLKSDVKTEL